MLAERARKISTAAWKNCLEKCSAEVLLLIANDSRTRFGWRKSDSVVDSIPGVD